MTAFADADWRRAATILLRVRPIAARAGGSHAQRDILDQTIAEAALRSGDRALALAIARERDELRPGHPSARRLKERADALAS